MLFSQAIHIRQYLKDMKSIFSFARKSEPKPEAARDPAHATSTDIWDADIFRKTPTGAEVARQQGTNAIPQRLRTVLMLIDGRTPLSSFSVLLVSYGDVREIFRMMVEMGLIEKVASNHTYSRRATDRAAFPDTMMGTRATAVSAPPIDSGMKAAVTDLCSALTDHLGIDAMDLCLAVERAPDVLALRALMPKIELAMISAAGANGRELVRAAYAKLGQ
jgi:hypothetical protein